MPLICLYCFIFVMESLLQKISFLNHHADVAEQDNEKDWPVQSHWLELNF